MLIAIRMKRKRRKKKKEQQRKRVKHKRRRSNAIEHLKLLWACLYNETGYNKAQVQTCLNSQIISALLSPTYLYTRKIRQWMLKRKMKKNKKKMSLATKIILKLMPPRNS